MPPGCVCGEYGWPCALHAELRRHEPGRALARRHTQAHVPSPLLAHPNPPPQLKAVPAGGLELSKVPGTQLCLAYILLPVWRGQGGLGLFVAGRCSGNHHEMVVKGCGWGLGPGQHGRSSQPAPSNAASLPLSASSSLRMPVTHSLLSLGTRGLVFPDTPLIPAHERQQRVRHAPRRAKHPDRRRRPIVQPKPPEHCPNGGNGGGEGVGRARGAHVRRRERENSGGTRSVTRRGGRARNAPPTGRAHLQPAPALGLPRQPG